MQSAIRAIDAVFRGLLAALMGAMVLCVTWQVVSRYVLGSPSSWTEELSRYLLIWVGLLGGSYAYHVKMHLGLDLLARKLPPAARRAQARFIHLAVVFFAVTALIGGGFELIRLTWSLGQHSAALGIPISLVYCSLPLSGVMLVLYACLGLFDKPAAEH